MSPLIQRKENDTPLCCACVHNYNALDGSSDPFELYFVLLRDHLSMIQKLIITREILRDLLHTVQCSSFSTRLAQCSFSFQEPYILSCIVV